MTYFLQEGKNAAVRIFKINILEVSNDITYNLQDGEKAALKSTFSRYQKTDHVLSVGAARTQQSDQHSADIKREITNGLQEGDHATVR